MGNRVVPCISQCPTAGAVEVKCVGGVQQALLPPDIVDEELHVAARTGDYFRVRVALLSGASLEEPKPSHAATGSRQEGAGLTALMHAARGGHFKCVMALLQARACVHTEDSKGRCPLHFAAASGNYEAGAVLNPAHGDNWWPLQTPPKSSNGNGSRAQKLGGNNEHLKCVIALLEARASVDVADAGGRCPLHFAAASGNYEVGTTLVYARANPGVRDKSGRRPPAYLNAPAHWPIEMWCDRFRCWLRLLRCTDEAEKSHKPACLPASSGPWLSPGLHPSQPLLPAPSESCSSCSTQSPFEYDEKMMHTERMNAIIPPLALALQSNSASVKCGKESPKSRPSQILLPVSESCSTQSPFDYDEKMTPTEHASASIPPLALAHKSNSTFANTGNEVDSIKQLQMGDGEDSSFEDTTTLPSVVEQKGECRGCAPASVFNVIAIPATCAQNDIGTNTLSIPRQETSTVLTCSMLGPLVAAEKNERMDAMAKHAVDYEKVEAEKRDRGPSIHHHACVHQCSDSKGDTECTVNMHVSPARSLDVPSNAAELSVTNEFEVSNAVELSMDETISAGPNADLVVSWENEFVVKNSSMQESEEEGSIPSERVNSWSSRDSSCSEEELECQGSDAVHGYAAIPFDVNCQEASDNEVPCEKPEKLVWPRPSANVYSQESSDNEVPCEKPEKLLWPRPSAEGDSP